MMLDQTHAGALRLIIFAVDADRARPFAESLACGDVAVQQAGCLETLIDCITAWPPDALLVLPLRDGRPAAIDAVRMMHGLPRLPYVVFAAPEDGPEERAAALEAGAAEVLHDGMPMPEAIARIRAVLRRVAVRHVEAVPWRLQESGRRLVTPGGDMLRLTSAEFDLIAVLASAGGAPVDRDAVCRTVFRRPWRPDDRAVDSLVKRLRPKLPDDAIQSVRGVGYALSLAVRSTPRTRGQT